MTYKKNDILLFKTNQPQSHLMEMFGYCEYDPDEIEEEEYIGYVESVLSEEDGMYQMCTIHPMEGFLCLAMNSDIIRKVEKEELPNLNNLTDATNQLHDKV